MLLLKYIAISHHKALSMEVYFLFFTLCLIIWPHRWKYNAHWIIFFGKMISGTVHNPEKELPHDELACERDSQLTHFQPPPSHHLVSANLNGNSLDKWTDAWMERLLCVTFRTTSRCGFVLLLLRLIAFTLSSSPVVGGGEIFPTNILFGDTSSLDERLCDLKDLCSYF